MPEVKKEKIKKYIVRIRKKGKAKGTDTSKYCGTVKFDEDALAIQKRLRNEWK